MKLRKLYLMTGKPVDAHCNCNPRYMLSRERIGFYS